MTAIHTVQLVCARTEALSLSDRPIRVCVKVYPSEPATGTVKALRLEAASAGWEVMRGAHGEDVCPPCRISAIRYASEHGTADAIDMKVAEGPA